MAETYAARNGEYNEDLLLVRPDAIQARSADKETRGKVVSMALNKLAEEKSR